MKPGRTALALTVGAFLVGCAYAPTNEASTQRVSKDYLATNGAKNVRAYVYGKRTVLEFTKDPAWVSAIDPTGKDIPLEKEGRYYRLPGKFDSFTARANGSVITFTFVKEPPAVKVEAVAPIVAQQAASTDVPYGSSLEEDAANWPQPKESEVAGGAGEIKDLLKLASKQLAEVRRALDEASQNPKSTGAELFEANARLDEIEAQLVKAAIAIVHVSFPSYGTTFKLNEEVASALLPAAKAADHINLRGHTDAKRAGPADPRIAHGRAMAARKYLIENGVPASKIAVSSQADGGFIALNTTKEGRALNRRVEIELVNNRITDLKGKAAQLAAQ